MLTFTQFLFSFSGTFGQAPKLEPNSSFIYILCNQVKGVACQYQIFLGLGPVASQSPSQTSQEGWGDVCQAQNLPKEKHPCPENLWGDLPPRNPPSHREILFASGAHRHVSLLRKQSSPSSPECLAVVLLWGSIWLSLLAEQQQNPQSPQQPNRHLGVVEGVWWGISCQARHCLKIWMKAPGCVSSCPSPAAPNTSPKLAAFTPIHAAHPCALLVPPTEPYLSRQAQGRGVLPPQCCFSYGGERVGSAALWLLLVAPFPLGESQAPCVGGAEPGDRRRRRRVDGCAGTFPVRNTFLRAAGRRPCLCLSWRWGLALSKEGSVGLTRAAPPCTLEGLGPGQGTGILGPQRRFKHCAHLTPVRKQFVLVFPALGKTPAVCSLPGAPAKGHVASPGTSGGTT